MVKRKPSGPTDFEQNRTHSEAEVHSLPQAARLAGVSYDFADQLDRNDIWHPSIRMTTGRGCSRLCANTDVLAMSVAGRLHQGGASRDALRLAIEAILQLGSEPVGNNIVLAIHPEEACLVREVELVGTLRHWNWTHIHLVHLKGIQQELQTRISTVEESVSGS